MTGKFSRDKGARAELELCKILHDYLGGEWNRNYKQTAQAQHGDIEQLVGGRYLVEVKNHKRLNIQAWWKQVCAAAKVRDAVPLLAIKIERQGWRFVIPSNEAQQVPTAWAWDLRYTQTLYIEGLALHVRELL